MASKRYTEEQAVGLTERLIGGSAATGKRALLDLAGARFGDVVVSQAAVAAVRQAGNDEVAEWLEAVRKSLRGGAELQALGIGLGLQASAVIFPGRVEISGPPRSMVLAQANILRGLVGDRLRLCDCGSVFVRQGKRRFCSPRCQKRVYMRRVRAGEAGED